jgi:ferredoxin
LQPLGKAVIVPRGTPLKDVLFTQGVEFPCGGEGYCLGCRVRVLQGTVHPTILERRVLEKRELEAGWRMACCMHADSDLTLTIGQWRDEILTTHPAFDVT